MLEGLSKSQKIIESLGDFQRLAGNRIANQASNHGTERDETVPAWIPGDGNLPYRCPQLSYQLTPAIEILHVANRDQLHISHRRKRLQMQLDSHLRQHTVQVDKTLQAIGHQVSESRRLLRLVYAALAAVEGTAIGAWDVLAESERHLAETIAVRTDEIAGIVAPSDG